MPTAVLGLMTLGEGVLGDQTDAGGAALGAIPLDEHMTWSDEHAWTPVRERVQPSVTGKPIITHATLQYGRPITLTRCWLTRSTVLTLRSLIDVGGYTNTLTLPDGRSFIVRWRQEDGAIEDEPAPLVSDPADDDRLMCVLRFMEILL